MIAKKSRGLWSKAETTLWSHTHTSIALFTVRINKIPLATTNVH